MYTCAVSMYSVQGTYVHYTCNLTLSLSLPPSLHPIAIPAPVSTRLKMEDVYDKEGKPRPDVLKQHFIREGRLDEDVALRIIHECKLTLAHMSLFFFVYYVCY